LTHDFSWIDIPVGHRLVRNAGAPPPGAIAAGFQNDGAGQLFIALANSQWGKIPAKATGNTAWYPYGGKEHATQDFEWIVTPFVLYNHNVAPVPGASVPQGFQNDGAGALHFAIAHTPHGNIPAKAKGNQAWYPYGGREEVTHDFSWVDIPIGFRTVHNSGGVPPGAIPAGFQNDGAGQLFLALANSQWGKIPAKAKGNQAWFPYGGKENVTGDFEWLIN
jgi:hypothetical protein